jgi:hypothetical protein
VEKRKFLTPPGFELRLLGCPFHSQPLCRLRYPVKYTLYSFVKKRFSRIYYVSWSNAVKVSDISFDITYVPVYFKLNIELRSEMLGDAFTVLQLKSETAVKAARHRNVVTAIDRRIQTDLFHLTQRWNLERSET